MSGGEEFWAEVTRAVGATLPEEWPHADIDLMPRFAADTPGLPTILDRAAATDRGPRTRSARTGAAIA